jgi:hypothetical protein
MFFYFCRDGTPAKPGCLRSTANCGAPQTMRPSYSIGERVFSGYGFLYAIYA